MRISHELTRNFPTHAQVTIRIQRKGNAVRWHGTCPNTLREEVAMRTVMKILVPIDFTATSHAALMYGRNLAKVFGADLHVLHVMENQFLRLTFKSAAAVETGMVRRVAEQLTDEDRASLHAVTVVRMSNAPADEIVQYANEENIDLIVMGTHGHNNVAHLLMG